MRPPDFHHDGWCLEDGEERHRESPSAFWIPERPARETLHPGDYAKLIFRIAIDAEEEPEAYERMWVIVRSRSATGYLGMLDNEPSAIARNDSFWRGTELPFEPKHIIDIRRGDADSMAIAAAAAPIPWR